MVRNGDFELLSIPNYLLGREIYVYGAGVIGRRCAKILKNFGVTPRLFLDRDSHKYGRQIDGIHIGSVSEISLSSNACVIIALSDEKEVLRVMKSLKEEQEGSICTFFALERLWRMTGKVSEDTLSGKLRMLEQWYIENGWERINRIRAALEADILVYQNGKMGSSYIYSILKQNIECAHIHRVFFKDGMVKQLICGGMEKKLADKLDFTLDTEWMGNFYGIFKGKKIITMVREPVSVDLSCVFQWLGTGMLDRYLGEAHRRGLDFLDIVVELMEEMKGRMLAWFDEEFKLTTGIDIYSYRFDRKSGYSIIREGSTEVLILQTEKMDELFPVISDFSGCKLEQKAHENVGENKIYASIYAEVKKRIELSREYLDFYYQGNEKLNHFYSMEDRDKFLKRWESHL